MINFLNNLKMCELSEKETNIKKEIKLNGNIE